MLEILKIVHIGALMAAAATGVGNGIFVRMLIRNPGPPPAMVADFMRTMGKVGLTATILLWLSGLGIVFGVHGTAGLGWLFYVKLAGATIALIGVLLTLRTVAQANAAGTPPPLERLKGLSNMTWSGVTIAVVFGVIRFS